MIFGKHINVYYRKYALALLTGLLALFTVDYLQLKVPEIYQLVINGLNQGYIVETACRCLLIWRSCWTGSVCPWSASSLPSSSAGSCGG